MEVTTLFSYITIAMEMVYQSHYVVRIVGGRRPAPDESKYVVSFQSRSHHNRIYGSGHFCGGAVLNSHQILSAAHCFDNKHIDDILALIGIYKLYVENTSVLGSRIDKIILHDNFDRSEHSNDIAVVYLKSEIKDYLPRVIPLYKEEINKPLKCHLLGWGQIYDTGPRIDRLYAVEFITRDMNFCFVDDANNKKIMVCAGSYNHSYACHGDSGGPLICNNKIAGVLSHGWGCEPVAFVFTKVAAYKEWVERGSANRNPTSFYNIFFIFITVLITKCI